MSGPRASRAAWWVAAVLAGCTRVPPALDARSAPSADTRGAAELAARVARAPARAEEPLRVVATTAGAAPEVVLFELGPTPSLRSRRALAAERRPELLGDAIVLAAGGAIVVLDAGSGRTRFTLPLEGGQLLGAAREGGALALCVRMPSEASGAPRTRVLVVDASSGAARFEHASGAELGQPVLRAGLVLLPWQRQGVVALDAQSGRQVALLRSRDDVIDSLHEDAREIWFGHHRLYALGRGFDGTRAGSAQVGPAAERLPGRPTPFPSAFALPPGVASAHGRVALHLAPRLQGAGVALEGDRAYFTFYRHVFAFDAAGALRWARPLGSDVVAARALPAGLLCASEDGTLSLLAALDGAVLARAGLGVAIATASVSGTRWPAPPTAPVEPALPLRSGLLAIALDLDARLVPSRAYAAAALGALPDPEASADLLEILRRSSTPPELARVVADALRGRRTGLVHLIDALLARPDFLTQSKPAPLAVLSPALVDARESRAVPNLLQRMLDHETPLSVLPTVVRAVVELGDASVVAPLLAFVRLYRNDSSFDESPEALVEAARGVLRHGGAEGEGLLASVSADGRVRPALSAALLALRPQGAPPVQPTAVAAAPAVPAAPLPRTLSQAAVDATFREHAADVDACLTAELERNPELTQVRITFVAESDGSAHSVQLVPAEQPLADCLLPRIQAYRFARFAGGRRVVRYTIGVERAGTAPQVPAATSARDAAFWWGASKRTRAKDPLLSPWWLSQHPIAPLVAKEPTPSPAAPASRGAPTESAAPPPAAAAAPRTSSPPSEATPAANAGTAEEDAWWIPSAPGASVPRQR